jgi:ribosomal protein L37AE/L43A
MTNSHNVLDEEILDVPAPVDEHECPVCHIKLKRTNCGKGPYCKHGLPLEVPCKQCKSVYNNRIYWNCPQCKYLKAELPPAQDWRVANIPRTKGRYMTKLPEEK